MKVLALDTSGDRSSVALLDTGTGYALAESIAAERGHAEIIFVQIKSLLERAGARATDIDRFAVTIGPGSFTGIRVGLAAARGLGLAAKRPVVGATTLEVLARATTAGAQAVRVAAIDARRGQIYFQAFGGAAAEPAAAAASDAAQALIAPGGATPFEIIGTGAELLLAALRDLGAEARLASGPSHPDPAVLARIAAEHTPNGPPRPLYLRAPDAKLPQGASL